MAKRIFRLYIDFFKKGERHVMGRPVQEVKARCFSVLKDPNVVAIVEGSSSPSAAYDLVFQATGDASQAKAGRWLAVLKRDHPEEYKKVLQGGRS